MKENEWLELPEEEINTLIQKHIFGDMAFVNKQDYLQNAPPEIIADFDYITVEYPAYFYEPHRVACVVPNYLTGNGMLLVMEAMEKRGYIVTMGTMADLDGNIVQWFVNIIGIKQIANTIKELPAAFATAAAKAVGLVEE